jgi:hypothetical protein
VCSSDLKPEQAAADVAPQKQDPRQLPFVAEALAAIEEGGYLQALARVGALMMRSQHGQSLPLAMFQLKQEMVEEYRDLLPDETPDEARRIRGEQDIICFYEPEAALAALPKLLTDMNDRKRFLTLLEKVESDRRFLANQLTHQQLALIQRVRQLLPVSAAKSGSKKAVSA